jgi:hypothetical protein
VNPAADRIRAWREDPRIFVREVFGVTPDPWQDEVLHAFATTQRIALKACKGPGKSTVESWCGWNFLLTRPHPKVICTSITGDNLRDGLWAEYAKWQGRSPLLREAFEWTNTRIFAKQHPETWFASARQWSKSADPASQADTLAGIHADYVLFQIDEAGGVPDSVASAAEAALSTGVETKLMLAGNPTLLSGPLYRACTRERDLWWVKEITGDPDDPMRAPRIDLQWARDQIAKYGRDNAWVLVNVFGQFPPRQSNSLIGAEDVAQAVKRTLTPQEYQQDARIIGVDVARFGDDRSVAFLRQGRKAYPPRVWRGLDLMTLSGHVADFMDGYQPDAVFVDQTGIGSGVVDRMRQLGRRVIGVDFGGKARDEKMANKRAEMWWLMAQWVPTASLPDISELHAELTAPTYGYANAQGRLQLESKEELKKRGLPSPDLADALALTFAEPVAHPGLRGVRRFTVHRSIEA